MLGALKQRLQRRIAREPRPDGGVQTASGSQTARTGSPTAPEGKRTCPNGCDAESVMVSTRTLLDSDDTEEWLLGNKLYDRDIDLISRCPECGAPDGEFAR